MSDDSDYIREWGRKAQFYERAGLYDDIARFIGKTDGLRTIEFGVGTGNLIGRLADRGALCVGVDNRVYALQTTKWRLEKRGHKSKIYTSRGPVRYESKIIESWHPHSGMTEFFCKDVVNLIGDDYTTAAVLEHYVERHGRPDLITLICSGGVEARDPDDLDKVCMHHMAGVITAHRLLRPGGKLVCLDKGPYGTTIGEVEKCVEDMLNGMERIFEIGRTDTRDVTERFLKLGYKQSPNWRYAVDVLDCLDENNKKIYISLVELIKKPVGI